jgi:hypothetical protein
MGTNYYLYPRADCECCGRPFEPLHIGKSSAGWCFSLHVIPEDGINGFESWQELWNRPGSVIRNEYNRELSVSEMEDEILNRSSSSKTDWDSDWWRGPFDSYSSEASFHYRNNSERGPNFLLRHRIDSRHCIGHGPGTYDLIVGEFF